MKCPSVPFEEPNMHRDVATLLRCDVLNGRPPTCAERPLVGHVRGVLFPGPRRKWE
jgi:hypothetical protein